MKPQVILPTFLLLAASSLSFGSYAETDADKAPVAGTQADKAAAKKMKPHSHMQEKTGIAPSETPSGAASDKSKRADKDRSRHFHPRDGK